MLAVSRAAQRAVEQRAEDRGLERFFDVPERAGFNRRDHALFAAFAGDQDGGDVFEFVVEFLEKFEAVHARQLDVCDQSFGREFGEARERIFGAAHAQDFVAPLAQQGFVALPGIHFVFDDKNALGGGSGLQFALGGFRHRCASRRTRAARQDGIYQ